VRCEETDDWWISASCNPYEKDVYYYPFGHFYLSEEKNMVRQFGAINIWASDGVIYNRQI
jgi:hypothetical protein